MVIEGHPRVLLPASGLLPYEIKVGAEPDRDLNEIEATTPPFVRTSDTKDCLVTIIGGVSRSRPAPRAS
jgi:hypothetical protein